MTKENETELHIVSEKLDSDIQVTVDGESIDLSNFFMSVLDKDPLSTCFHYRVEDVREAYILMAGITSIFTKWIEWLEKDESNHEMFDLNDEIRSGLEKASKAINIMINKEE